jgi:hypothetical protein
MAPLSFFEARIRPHLSGDQNWTLPMPFILRESKEDYELSFNRPGKPHSSWLAPFPSLALAAQVLIHCKGFDGFCMF